MSPEEAGDRGLICLIWFLSASFLVSRTSPQRGSSWMALVERGSARPQIKGTLMDLSTGYMQEGCSRLAVQMPSSMQRRRRTLSLSGRWLK